MCLKTVVSTDSRADSPTTLPLKTSNPVNPSLKTITDKKTDAKVALANTRPWYRAGGLTVSLNGMGINIFGGIIFLALQIPDEQRKQFLAFMVLCILSSCITCRTLYCILIVPSTMASTVLVAQFANWPFLLVLSVALAMVKVNICMSVCLHRYAAHNAFKCGPVTSFILLVLGCLANQGGPLWWASQHRCHHKYCDVPRDPHSQILVGKEKAFGFFHDHEPVEEEFVPRLLETVYIRTLDTWSFIFVGLELLACNYFFGAAGVFCAHTSAWLCQSITCWFNVVNHPDEQEGKCKASDGKAAVDSWYLPFYILDAFYPLFGLFIMEGNHGHHHDNASLAKRSWYDPAYWGFIMPLEAMGLVWNVKV